MFGGGSLLGEQLIDWSVVVFIFWEWKQQYHNSKVVHAIFNFLSLICAIFDEAMDIFFSLIDVY